MEIESSYRLRQPLFCADEPSSWIELRLERVKTSEQEHEERTKGYGQAHGICSPNGYGLGCYKRFCCIPLMINYPYGT